jgi:hypothetical protein
VGRVGLGGLNARDLQDTAAGIVATPAGRPQRGGTPGRYGP